MVDQFDELVGWDDRWRASGRAAGRDELPHPLGDPCDLIGGEVVARPRIHGAASFLEVADHFDTGAVPVDGTFGSEEHIDDAPAPVALDLPPPHPPALPIILPP